jgi:hypothetical protein
MRVLRSSTSQLAHRLLQSLSRAESVSRPPPGDTLTECLAAFRPGLTQLVGPEGFRALLARALALAKPGAPFLAAVQVDGASYFTGLNEALSGRTLSEADEATAEVLAQFLWLLAGFIGGALTRRLVTNAWPDTVMTDTDFEPEAPEA